VGRYEERGFAVVRGSTEKETECPTRHLGSPQQIRVHFCAFDDTEYIALDDLQHFFPGLSLDSPQTEFPISSMFARDMIRRLGKPDLEKFFWAFERRGSLDIYLGR
jgi:hypothetical protein